MRRYESLPRMFLTLLAALLFGALLEAEGLHTWAERLGVGPLREIALPVTSAWNNWLQPAGLGRARAVALQVKAGLAPVLLGETLEKPDITSLSRADSVPAFVAEAMHQPYLRPPLREPVPGIAADEVRIDDAPRLPMQASGQPSMLAIGSGLQVVLAGDSMMAVGLAPALTRGLAADKGVRLVKAYRSGTGLARPEVYDWLQQYPQMLGMVRPQLVICALGANDGQNVQVGKQVLEFGSQEWDDFYRSRLNAYLDMLLKTQARVLWVGMPVMKERRFAQKMRHMNELVRTELQRYPAVTWLDPNPALGYADEVFAQYRPGERGKLVKLRADDGIHMTDEGAGYLLGPIREWIVRMSAQVPELAPASVEQVAGGVL